MKREFKGFDPKRFEDPEVVLPLLEAWNSLQPTVPKNEEQMLKQGNLLFYSDETHDLLEMMLLQRYIKSPELRGDKILLVFPLANVDEVTLAIWAYPRDQIEKETWISEKTKSLLLELHDRNAPYAGVYAVCYGDGSQTGVVVNRVDFSAEAIDAHLALGSTALLSGDTSIFDSISTRSN